MRRSILHNEKLVGMGQAGTGDTHMHTVSQSHTYDICTGLSNLIGVCDVNVVNSTH